MKKNDVYEKVIEIVAEVAECETNEISPDTSLPDALEVDSLMGLEILVMIEREFGVKIGEDKLQEMSTPEKITSLIMEYAVTVAA